MELNKNKISSYIRMNNVSVRNLESQAGLARNAIYNIMHNRSKNPTIDTIVKIAKIINCSIEELLSLDPLECSKIQKSVDDIQITYNRNLYENTFSFVNNNIVESVLKNLDLLDITRIVNSIYKYSYLNNNKLLDKTFAQWMLKDYLEKNK